MKKSISDSKSLFLLILVVIFGFSGFVLANQGDLSGDGDVNQIDLSLFADQWLANNCTFNDWCEGADINHSGNVDFNDFASFAKNWLLMDETRVESLLSQMTLAEKITQLAGDNLSGFETPDLTRLGIPGFRMSDGPSGVRWNQTPCPASTCFPSPLAVSATWDPELVLRVGKAMGRESRGKGRYVLLAPMVNIIRDPRGGRDSETLGEDPYLTTQIGLSYVKGIQSQKVIAVIKHFACNNQEQNRGNNDVQVNERTLREIYLPPYEAAVKEDNVWGVMSAYNKVNGYWCAENTHLLTDILKNEWGFKGFVVSDWGGTHSTVGSANAGLDVEMPGGTPPTTYYFSAANLTPYVGGQVPLATIDAKVKRILRAKIWSGVLDNPIVVDGNVTVNPAVINSPEHQALAREASKKSIVLLKNATINAAKILPLNKNTLTSIAVIGPNAEVAQTGNGGSSHLTPYYTVSPLAGIEGKLAGTGVTINFAHGHSDGYSAIPSSVLKDPNGNQGLRGEYYNNKTLTAPSTLTRIDSTVNFDWGGGSPAPEVNANNFSVRWSGTLTPTQTGDYEIGVITDDGGRLYLDGVKIVDVWWDQSAPQNPTTVTRTFTAGVAHSITFEYYENGGDAVAKLLWAVPGAADWLTEAAIAAAASNVAVVCVGTNASIESEGSDRADIILPESGDALINAVSAANPKTIVVVVSGSAVRMSPWINDVNVPAVLECWFGGQESGNAIADVLFGDENPSGKLPITLPKDVNQLPPFDNTYETAGNGPGYRYFDRIPLEPQFPFGHGLSYTDFEYSNLIVPAEVSSGDDSLNISVDVKNIGSRSGAEVAQLYIHAANSSVLRAVKELKGFKKITLEPQEKQTVVFTLPLKELRFYNTASSAFVLESGNFGNFDVMVGSSSRDIRLTGAFHVY